MYQADCPLDLVVYSGVGAMHLHRVPWTVSTILISITTTCPCFQINMPTPTTPMMGSNAPAPQPGAPVPPGPPTGPQGAVPGTAAASGSHISAPQPQFGYHEINVMSLSSLASHINVNENVSAQKNCKNLYMIGRNKNLEKEIYWALIIAKKIWCFLHVLSHSIHITQNHCHFGTMTIIASNDQLPLKYLPFTQKCSNDLSVLTGLLLKL